MDTAATTCRVLSHYFCHDFGLTVARLHGKLVDRCLEVREYLFHGRLMLVKKQPQFLQDRIRLLHGRMFQRLNAEKTILNRLAVEGIRLTLNDEKLEATGKLQNLTDELRDSIRAHRFGLLKLLPASPVAEDAYAQQEREAIRWSDTDDAWRYLDYACQLFAPCEMRILDKPERIAQYEQGLISGDDLDDWLSNCNHDPNSGTWHLLDNEQCCRYCGGCRHNYGETQFAEADRCKEA